MNFSQSIGQVTDDYIFVTFWVTVLDVNHNKRQKELLVGDPQFESFCSCLIFAVSKKAVYF